MENNKELIFRVMATFYETLEMAIQNYNNSFKTDFKIIEVIYDEVIFCDIKVTKYQVADIFNLGFCFSRLELKLREKGEIDW